jgi:hypothetical protein
MPFNGYTVLDFGIRPLAERDRDVVPAPSLLRYAGEVKLIDPITKYSNVPEVYPAAILPRLKAEVVPVVVDV